MTTTNRQRKAKRRRNRTTAKTVAKLEAGLAKLSNIRQHHADRIKTLDTKIAAAEAEIEIVKEEAAEDDAAETEGT